MTHAVLGPSSADRWINCPGSVALSQGIADRNSDAADEGTAYHFLASTCLTNGKNAKDYVGSVIEVRLDDTVAFVANRNDPPFRSSYTIDTDNAAFCQRYIDYVRTVALNNILEVEVAVPISEYTDEQNAEGTSDAIVINQDQQEMSVIDLKFGRGVEVTAENNPQLMMYALGALEKYTMLYEIQTVRMVIVQPRAGDGKPQEWVLHVSDLLDFGVKVKRAATSVWAALSLYNEIMASGNQLPDVFRAWCDQYLLVTEKGCMWCRAKSRCPMIAKTVEQVTGANFDGLEEMPDVLPVDIIEAPGKHKNADLAVKLGYANIIEGWIKAIRAEAESELLKGDEVPGWKVVQGKRGNRAWTDPAAVEERMKKSMRLKDEIMYDFKLISPTTAEKRLADKPKQWGWLKDRITQAEGGLSIAPESDKRPAVSIQPTADGMGEVADEGSDLV